MDLADAVASIEALRSDLNYVLDRAPAIRQGLAAEALRRHSPPVTATHLSVDLRGQQAAILDLLSALAGDDKFGALRAELELSAWEASIPAPQQAPPPPPTTEAAVNTRSSRFSWVAFVGVGGAAAALTAASSIHSVGGPAQAQVADWLDAGIGGAINLAIFGGIAGGIGGRTARGEPGPSPGRGRWWGMRVLAVIAVVAMAAVGLGWFVGSGVSSGSESAVRDPFVLEACSSVDDFLAEIELGAEGHDPAVEALRNARQSAARSSSTWMADQTAGAWSLLADLWGDEAKTEAERQTISQNLIAKLERIMIHCTSSASGEGAFG